MECRNLSRENEKTALRLPLLLALALLATPLAYSLDWGGAAQVCIGSALAPIGDFDMPISITVIMMMLLITLAYMGGKILQKEEMGVWAKIEGQNLLISGLLVLCVLAAFASGCAMLQYTAPSGGASPYQSIDANLGKLSNKYGLDIAKNLVSKSMDNQMSAVAYIYYVESPFYQKGISYKANLRAQSQYQEMVADMQIPFLMIIQAQRIGFMAVEVMVVTILLPAAILFRTLFVTRDIGNFLIALSFGLYIAVPMLYVIAFQAYGNIDIDVLYDIPRDNVVGDALIRIGYITPAAILLPNLAMVVLISFVMAAHKGLRGIGV